MQVVQERRKSAGVNRDFGGTHLEVKCGRSQCAILIINDLQWRAGGGLVVSEGSKNPARWPGW